MTYTHLKIQSAQVRTRHVTVLRQVLVLQHVTQHRDQRAALPVQPLFQRLGRGRRHVQGRIRVQAERGQEGVRVGVPAVSKK